MGENKDKLKGKVKETVGTVTGNRGMQAEGIGLQARRVIRGVAKDLTRTIKRSARRNPQDSGQPKPADLSPRYFPAFAQPP